MEPYLTTCIKGKELYNQFIHGREYLTKDLHRYSVSDLVEFQEESLEALLVQLYEAGRKHIFLCETCGLKGQSLLFLFFTDRLPRPESDQIKVCS